MDVRNYSTLVYFGNKKFRNLIFEDMSEMRPKAVPGYDSLTLVPLHKRYGRGIKAMS